MENSVEPQKQYWETIQTKEYNEFVIKVLERYYGSECFLNINNHKYGVVCFPGKDSYGATSLRDYDNLCDKKHSKILGFNVDEHQSFVNNEWYTEYNKVIDGKVHHSNRPGYMLDEIVTDAEGRFDKLRVHVGTYAENVFSSHALDYELYQAYLRFSQKDISDPNVWEELRSSLVLRNKIHERIGTTKDKGLSPLLKGEGRDSLLSVQMLVIVKSEETNQYELIVTQRSNTVALKPGVYQFIPSGGFDILNDSNDGIYNDLELEDNYSPGCAIFREYLEELYNEPEFEGRGEGSIRQRLLKDPRIKTIQKMLANKRADLHFLGSVMDLTTLRHELSFVLVLHEDLYSDAPILPNDECMRHSVWWYSVRDFDNMNENIIRSIWDNIHTPSAAMWYLFRQTDLYKSLVTTHDTIIKNESLDHRIFISYKRVDKDKVFDIKNYIERNTGLDCWIDLDDIQSDAWFAGVIVKAINNADVFLFMYSKAHTEIIEFDQDWTVREIRFAQKKKKRIVFINIDHSPLSDSFEFMYGAKEQVDALSKDAMEKLLSELRYWLSN